MKKRNIFALLMLALLTAVGVACNKASSQEDTEEEVSELDAALEILNEKEAEAILNHFDEGTITKKEISKAIEMLDAFVTVRYSIVEEAINKADSEEKAKEFFADKWDKYDFWYADGLADMLYNMSEEEMGSANFTKFKKLNEKAERISNKMDRKSERKFGSFAPSMYDSDFAEEVEEIQEEIQYEVPADADIPESCIASYPV